MLHEPKDMETKPYLMKLVSYLSVVMPDFKFNSALINRYIDSGKHIPHHSNNEEAIDPSSDILTVFLGSVLQATVHHSTVIEYKNLVLPDRNRNMVLLAINCHSYIYTFQNAIEDPNQ